MSPEIWQAILLGVVQGVGEFLPISSKGHLLIAQELLRRYAPQSVAMVEPLEMTVALHFGTLLSIAVVYWQDLKRLIRQPRLCLWIVVATIPVGLVGATWKDSIEGMFFENLIFTGFGLLVTAVLLWIGEKCEGKSELGSDSLATMNLRQAGLIGLFQVIALLPGISRSGSTIVGGLFAGLRRDAAAQFSFFIAIPAILGASVLKLKDALGTPHSQENVAALLVGTTIAFVVGVLSLRWLIRLIVRRKLHWFSYYCLVVGVIIIIWQLSAPRLAAG